jgi:selenocysteine lyase/cysteine desulfurase
MVAIRDEDPERLAAYLTERRVVTSPRGDFLRLSAHYYTDGSDIDAVVRAIAAYRASSG